MIKLKYGNTNTFFIRGDQGVLLIDTDYAGTLLAFYKTIKNAGIRITDIKDASPLFFVLCSYRAKKEKRTDGDQFFFRSLLRGNTYVISYIHIISPLWLIVYVHDVCNY